MKYDTLHTQSFDPELGRVYHVSKETVDKRIMLLEKVYIFLKEIIQLLVA